MKTGPGSHAGQTPMESDTALPSAPALLAPILEKALQEPFDSEGVTQSLLDNLHGFGGLSKSHLARFELDGLQFTLRPEPLAKGHVLHFYADVGNLPYHAESAEKRARLLAILEAAQHLQGIRFVLDTHQQIVLHATLPFDDHVAGDAVFHHLVTFYQQARPFVQLIAQHL